METKLFELNSPGRKPRAIEQAAKILSKGGVIVYPTETSYALGADATNPRAVKKVFGLKGREVGKALPVIAAGLEMIGEHAVLDARAKKLARRFMPGPLTLILEKRRGAGLAREISQSGIAFRIPGNELAQGICRRLGKPVTATSANRSGEASIYSEGGILKKFVGNVDAIISAGDLPRKPASTIVDLRGGGVRLVRAGPVSFRAVLKELNTGLD